MRVFDFFQLLLLAALWGASFLFMRIAAPQFGAVWLIEFRVLLAGLIFLPFALRGENRSQFQRNLKHLAMVGLLNSAVPFSLLAYASISMTAGFTSILNATAALFGMAIALLYFRERFSTIRTLGFVIGFAGVVVIAGFSSGSHDLGFYLAFGGGLIAGLSYAIAAYYIKANLGGVPSMVVTSGSMLWAALLLLPLLPFTSPQQMPNALAIGSLVALSLFSTAWAFLIYFQLVQKIGSSRVLTVAYLIPLFSTLWGAIFLREVVQLSTVIGGVLILGGTAVANQLDRKTTKAQN